jgi:hypothetical protein
MRALCYWLEDFIKSCRAPGIGMGELMMGGPGFMTHGHGGIGLCNNCKGHATGQANRVSLECRYIAGGMPG